MNGEINVNINGKEETLKITMWQFWRMKKLIEENPEDLSRATSCLIFSALENGYRFKKIACPYSFEEIDLWTDGLTAIPGGDAELQRINNEYLQTEVYKGLDIKKKE